MRAGVPLKEIGVHLFKQMGEGFFLLYALFTVRIFFLKVCVYITFQKLNIKRMTNQNTVKQGQALLFLKPVFTLACVCLHNSKTTD